MPKTKTIPDRVFHKIWSYANEIDNKEEYIALLISYKSKERIHFKEKYNINLEESEVILNRIYEASKKSFKEIIDSQNMKKSMVSHVFCIPIRTIEDWYSGKNSCPSYIRLMLLKYFRILNIGKYIEIESDKEHDINRPRKYRSYKVKKVENSYKKNNEKISINEMLYGSDEYRFELIRENVKETDRIEIEQSIAINKILNKTDYLDEIIKHRKGD